MHVVDSWCTSFVCIQHPFLHKSPSTKIPFHTIHPQAWNVANRLGMVGPAFEQPEYNIFKRNRVEQVRMLYI